jgi:hypothetical protein
LPLLSPGRPVVIGASRRPTAPAAASPPEPYTLPPLSLSPAERGWARRRETPSSVSLRCAAVRRTLRRAGRRGASEGTEGCEC